jgi:hypothetical protein
VSIYLFVSHQSYACMCYLASFTLFVRNLRHPFHLTLISWQGTSPTTSSSIKQMTLTPRNSPSYIPALDPMVTSCLPIVNLTHRGAVWAAFWIIFEVGVLAAFVIVGIVSFKVCPISNMSRVNQDGLLADDPGRDVCASRYDKNLSSCLSLLNALFPAAFLPT